MPDNNTMHAKPDLRVSIEVMISVPARWSLPLSDLRIAFLNWLNLIWLCRVANWIHHLNRPWTCSVAECMADWCSLVADAIELFSMAKWSCSSVRITPDEPKPVSSCDWSWVIELLLCLLTEANVLVLMLSWLGRTRFFWLLFGSVIFFVIRPEKCFLEFVELDSFIFSGELK